MKFRISRTSMNDDKSPCEEAIYESYEWTQTRPEYKSIEDYDKQHKYLKWESYGSNHRVTEQGIARDRCDDYWFVEITDIVAFAEKYGQIIIFPKRSMSLPEIEIYDSFRE